MSALTRQDLLSLETYAAERAEFRARVLAHKKARAVHIGPHLVLLFEDRLTIQYQVQEMLRIEKTFEAAGIEEELAAYNPLIPDGQNLKATMLIEYADVDERKRELVRLRGIEDHVELRVGGHAPSVAIADEDLPRSNDEKTSAVHFLRFELDPEMISSWRHGESVSFACTHPQYLHQHELGANQRDALAKDFA